MLNYYQLIQMFRYLSRFVLGKFAMIAILFPNELRGNTDCCCMSLLASQQSYHDVSLEEF